MRGEVWQPRPTDLVECHERRYTMGDKRSKKDKEKAKKQKKEQLKKKEEQQKTKLPTRKPAA